MATQPFTFSEYKNYFQNICAKYKPFKPVFHRHDIEDFLTNTVTKLDGDWAFIMEGLEYDTTDERSDNTFKNKECAFMLLFKHSKRNNTFDELDAKLTIAERFADDVFRRLKNDTVKQKQPFQHIRLAGYMVKEIPEGGLLLPDWRGIRVNFTLQHPMLNIAVDNQTWEDL
jgi:hypothetical protein